MIHPRRPPPVSPARNRPPTGRRLHPWLCLLLLLPAGPAWGRTRDAVVTGVPDGDTLAVRCLDGRVEWVRLLGIDAPEVAHPGSIGQEPWGSRARVWVRQRLQGRRISLQGGEPERDRYGRLLAYVLLDGHCVNLALVEAGLALAYSREDGPWPQRLRAAERTAQARGIGIWQRPGGLQEAPSAYRRHVRAGEVDQPFRE